MKNLQVRVKTDIVTEPVSATEAKLFCKVTGTDEDTLFTILISAARRALEKYTGCSFAEKELYATWIETPEDDLLELPYGPVISVDKVYRIDEEGTEELITLNADYYVLGDQDAVVRVEKYWSSGDVHQNSIRVEYHAGYGDSTTETLPTDLKLAILKQIATDYEMRENIALTGATVLSNEAKTLAFPYKKKIWF